jgi:hypothetical protein
MKEEKAIYNRRFESIHYAWHKKSPSAVKEEKANERTTIYKIPAHAIRLHVLRIRRALAAPNDAGVR